MIQLQSITKNYKNKTVLNKIDLKIKKNTPLIILGKNGVGKSTLTKIILGFEVPTSGTILYDQKKYRIGYLPEFRGLYKDTTVEEIIKLFNNLSTKKLSSQQLQKYISEFELDDYLYLPVHKLSKGNQQKVQLALSLINDPQLVVLDEPFSGLDPHNKGLFVKLIKKYALKDKYLIIITHSLLGLDIPNQEIFSLKDGKVFREQNNDSAQPISLTITGYLNRSIYEDKINTSKLSLNDSDQLLNLLQIIDSKKVSIHLKNKG